VDVTETPGTASPADDHDAPTAEFEILELNESLPGGESELLPPARERAGADQLSRHDASLRRVALARLLAGTPPHDQA
jgi:hypothetical protein